jgi:hypothetical protein
MRLPTLTDFLRQERLRFAGLHMEHALALATELAARVSVLEEEKRKLEEELGILRRGIPRIPKEAEAITTKQDDAAEKNKRSRRRFLRNAEGTS